MEKDKTIERTEMLEEIEAVKREMAEQPEKTRQRVRKAVNPEHYYAE